MSGGAWKVAYADFVTAMMALFMVLWISAQDDEIILSTAQYFRDPFGIGFKDGVNGNLTETDGGNAAAEVSDSGANKSSLVDLAFLNKLASEYYKLLNVDQNDPEKQINVTVTPDGLKITIFDKSKHPLFEKNTADFTEWGRYVMQNLAWIIDRNNMSIKLESYMPEGFKSSDPNFGPWELTAARSNAARRALEHYSISEGKINQVTGFGDAHPLEGVPKDSIENQRLEISLVVE